MPFDRIALIGEMLPLALIASRKMNKNGDKQNIKKHNLHVLRLGLRARDGSREQCLGTF